MQAALSPRFFSFSRQIFFVIAVAGYWLRSTVLLLFSGWGSVVVSVVYRGPRVCAGDGDDMRSEVVVPESLPCELHRESPDASSSRGVFLWIIER